MNRRRALPFVLILCGLIGGPAFQVEVLGQAPAPPSDAPAKPKTKAKAKRKVEVPAGPKVYMGREIADVMSHLGADWLIRDTREAEEQPERMLDALKIQPGWSVADVGAGVGYTSLRMAKRVGPKGTVYATDVQPQMLKMLGENAKTFGVGNVKPILCVPTDPKLPDGKLDLILMVDVYHECSEPEATLKGLRKALKADGRLVLVEFREEDPEVPIKPEHKMSIKQAKLELQANGFVFKESLEFLPWQHILIFNKAPDKETPAPSSKTKEVAK